MQISKIFAGLGEDVFAQLLRTISIGKLKTFQLYERMKVRLHLAKLNSETIRKAAPRLWSRLNEGDEDLATELSQCILISHLDMVKAVLDELGIPNDEGFFAKDLDPAPYFSDGWQTRVYDKFKDRYSHALLLFYINHLGWELGKLDTIFTAPGEPVAS